MNALSNDAVQQQRTEFEALLQRLGTASASEINEVLANREVVEPEPELSPEIVKQLQTRIAQQSVTH
jgi:uncharacterized membrane protein